MDEHSFKNSSGIYNDDFMEVSVGKADTALGRVLYAVSWVFLVILAIVAVFFLYRIDLESFDASSIICLLIFVLCGGGAVALFFLKDYALVEYDYTFTAGTLDVARILARSKRKHLLSVNLDSVEYIAPIGYRDFEKELRSADFRNRYNYFVHRGSALYYMMIVRGSSRSMLIFEPTEELLNLYLRRRPKDVLIRIGEEPRGSRFS